MPQKTYLGNLVSGPIAKRVGCYSLTNTTGIPCSSNSMKSMSTKKSSKSCTSCLSGERPSMTSSNNNSNNCSCTSSCTYGPYTFNYYGCGQGSPFQVYWNTNQTQACCYQNNIPINCPSCIWPPNSACGNAMEYY